MSTVPAAAVLRSVMDGVPAAIAIADGAGVVVEGNARWNAICRGAELPERGVEWWSLIDPADHARLPCGVGPAIEARVRAADSGTRWVSVTTAPIGEEASGMVVTLTDIGGSKRDEAERAALHRVADAVTRGDDTPRVFARVAQEVAWVVGADGAGVARFEDADTARLVGRWAADQALDADTSDALPLRGEGTTARVYATGMPSRVDYAQMTGAGERLPHPWRISAAAPIRVEGRLWGALGVVSRRPGRLADDAEQRLERFADFVGIAIANAEARESLVRQASTDPLTGLAHHGAFHDSLCEEVARATRYGHPLSLAVIDIDHFKRVNDAHGHQVGDQTLRGVAARLQAHARAIDVIARIGGEEFAWLMPQTAAPGARAAVERFRVAVGDAAFGAVLRLTVSAGIAELGAARAADASELFRLADRALYRAKGAGRDRTMVSADGAGKGVA
ncbi:MAG: sensor domain-containing diguanylate cyclase [Thermoleophilia bacterium]|nr:sensor domain-containing diguanylate cyclase [Thermoleophilia bacterium]